MEYIAFDAHKHYTLASVARPDGQLVREERVEHDRGALRHFLERCEQGSPVAVETVGNWYWIVDEIEAAGFHPKLVHARKAKLMMGMINKTDKLEVRGFEHRMQTVFKVTPDIRLLMTVPGVGLILAVVIALEIGDVARFATAEKLAAYAGTTPRVHASGGKTRFGRLRPDVNRYLKW